MAVLIIMLIVAFYEITLVSPSSNNFQNLLPFASKNEFASSDKRHDHHDESLSHGVCFRSRVQHSPDEYYLTVSIGTTNPSPVTAIIDTGSDLTWNQCQPCKNKCLNQTTPIFNPKKSSTYVKLKCSSNMCNSNFTRLPTSCGKHGVCEYKRSYGGGVYTSGGVLATENFTFEGNVSIPKIYFGCAFENRDDYNNGYPGILGLSRGNLSFIYQIKARQFSHCFPSYRSNKSGNFSMGCPVNIPPKAKATPIVKNPLHPSFYYVSLERISIGNAVLPINHTKFEIQLDGSGGMFFDSGTTHTLLEDSTFDLVTNELTRQLKLPSFYDLDMDSLLCYNITSCTKTKNFPNFVFHFKDADFVVKPENYFNISADKKFGCLMMAPSGFDGSVFGNYQQQNALVVYDLANDKLSFLTNTNCM